MFCPVPDAPLLCFPDAYDWIAMGVGVLGWVFAFFLKWIDPARPAIEQITGKRWWRNW